MTKPYSDEIIAGIDQFEEKYGIELVSIEHHREWVDRCERLTTQRGALLEAGKLMIKYLEWEQYQGGDSEGWYAEKLRAAIAQAEEE